MKSPVIPPYDTRTKFIEDDRPSNSHEKWFQKVGVAINNSPQITETVPATPTSAGVQGQQVIAGGFVYYCIAANSWVRGVVSTW